MKYSLKLLAISLAFIVTGLSVQSAKAQTPTFTVRNVSDVWVPNACETNTSGCSLRGAILAANPARGGAIIRFNIPQTEPFCFGTGCTIVLTSALPTITGPGTRIIGPGAGAIVVVPGSSQAQLLRVENTSGTVTISGISLVGGTADFGGAIYKSGAGVLDVSNLVFRENHAGQGGAIYMGAGTLIVTFSLFDQNSAFRVTNPPSVNGGGAIYSAAGSTTVVGCTFVSNSSKTGGAIQSLGTMSVYNSTIARNTATVDGGGIAKTSGSLTLTVRSSIIADNDATNNSRDVFGAFISAGFNLIGRIDGGTGFNSPSDLKGTAASPLDPKLAPNGLSLMGGTIPVLAISLQSLAIDKGSDVLPPELGGGNVPVDQRGSGFRRVRDNPRIPNAPGGNGTDIGAYERHVTSVFDFDGDGRTEVAIFRPSVAEWWLYRGLTGTVFAAQFGAPTDKPVPADYTGDGKTDIAFWRPATGQWFVVRSEDGTFFAAPFGASSDIPVPADYDSDGKADVAVFRPSTGFWFVQRSSDSQVTSQQFGQNGDQPVQADYDGDGQADVAIYRPSVGEWWLNRTTAGTIAYSFGNGGDKVVPGDYTGDGKTDVAFWRPSTGEWFVIRSSNNTFFSAPFGASTDLPTPGDYDGDTEYDFAVFRPSTGTWFINHSNGGTAAQQFGANQDLPLPRSLLP